MANFGAQKRETQHIDLIAEIVSWFDLVALQELRDNLGDLNRLMDALPRSFRYVMTDVAGNNERMAFLYRGPKVKLTRMVAEVAVPPSQHRWVKLPGVDQSFTGFDRNPHVATFQVRDLQLMFANAHLYFGSTSRKESRDASIGRRSLEAYALARWADLRRRSPHSVTNEIVALGDFNMPKRDPDDPVHRAITRRGLRVPEHSAVVAASIASDAEYDQVAVFPGPTEDRLVGGLGVFDFDTVVFPALWETRRRSFKGYLRYYLSDHRPLWFEMTLD